MTKKKGPANNLVSGGTVKEIQSCRPLRLFIKKQRKKGSESKPFALRSEFSQLAMEKQAKYFQKAVDKYIQLLDEKDISAQVQVKGQLLDNVLSKKEKEIYFQSIDAPTKPPSTALGYYIDLQKQENNDNPKIWKSLTADEKKPYLQMLNDAKVEYSIQTKNFAENLPERLKSEYLSFISQAHSIPIDNDENPNAAPIRQRRKSVQPLPESFKTIANDSQQKLTRSQLDDLHKCKPNVLYFEKKMSEEEKSAFPNVTTKNTYIRTLFNQLSEKKRHKFILKGTAKWEEYLQSNPTITENQTPTIHLLLGKNDDIHYYFSSLGLPIRPPISALYLYNNERQQTGSQLYWADLSQSTKDDYIKRLSKLKNEYHQKFVEFVEKTLPSDYIRLEFFRHMKYAAKDYELAVKDRVVEKDDKQSKITQYLTPKKKITNNDDVSEFDRIKQQLLSTQLTNEQKKLVERLGQLMNKYKDETTVSKSRSSNSKSSTVAPKSNNDRAISPSSSRRQSTSSADVVILNGELSSDNIEHSEETTSKKKKKRKRAEAVETSTEKVTDDKEKVSSKKRK